MKSILIGLTLIFFSISSLAEDTYYFSGILGVGQLNSVGTPGPSYDSSLTYGLRTGLAINNNFTTGLFIKELQGGYGGPVRTTNRNIMFEGSYFLNGIKENGFWFGGLLGLSQVKEHGNGSFSDMHSTDLAFGANVAYQFMLTQDFSISPQLSYIYTSGGSATDYSDISTVVNMNIWF